MLQNNVEQLKNQLQVARNEINKLRQQVRGLQQKQRKDVDGIAAVLKNYRCEGCRKLENIDKIQKKNNDVALSLNEADSTQAVLMQQQHQIVDCFNSIGIVRTAFPEKRAVPRQANVGGHLRGIIELHADLFTNPEHALQGLEEYSHLWILYHFHRNVGNGSSTVKAKVAPPRLGGERIGVFATRSPHRPCAIGLSLVEIEKIDGSQVSFFGIDMVDGTPVLDIKPYIPYYDAPRTVDTGRLSVGLGSENTSDFQLGSRQEPDGEESEMEIIGATAAATTNVQTPLNFPNFPTPPPLAVKVPAWVQTPHRLHVNFNEKAILQLHQLPVERQCIVDILEADPRSVYLRTKYNSQIFTFQLGEVQVTCKFDDKNSNVTVLQIRPTDYISCSNDQSTTQNNQTMKE